MPKRSHEAEIEEDVKFDDNPEEEQDDTMKEFLSEDDDDLEEVKEGEEGFFDDE